MNGHESFRGEVVCSAVRATKASEDAVRRWNAILNARRPVTLEGVAFLKLHFPDPLPSRKAATTLLAVGERRTSGPADWEEVDL